MWCYINIIYSQTSYLSSHFESRNGVYSQMIQNSAVIFSQSTEITLMCDQPMFAVFIQTEYIIILTLHEC